MADGKLGIWFIGACGNVATTATLGLLALQRKLAPPVGLVTELPAFQPLPLVGWDHLVVGGCDIRRPTLVATAERLGGEGVVPTSLLDACRGDLSEIEGRITAGIAHGAGEAIAKLAQVPPLDERNVAPRKLIDQLRGDLQAFAQKFNLSSVVVVNVASTEPALVGGLPDTWAGLAQLLDRPGAAIPPSVLYAIAAIELRMPFVNFTPSVGAALPAVEELAGEKKICHAGRDGKTGETLLKTVLAPMFASRNLEVLSWVGHNIFGNLDGKVLDNPANRAAKVATKDRVLGSVLGYDPQTLVSIEYIESLGDWKTAWDHVHFRGFLGTLMTLQLTWQGSDSALAAPLVLDLVRLVDVANRAGETGALGPLAAFFKSPLGSPEHDFAKQHQALVEWARATAEKFG